MGRYLLKGLGSTIKPNESKDPHLNTTERTLKMPPKATAEVGCKLLLIGDSGVGKSCLLLRFADDSFTPSFITTIGIDFKTRKLNLNDKVVKVAVWDTAGQERFRTITQAYYRGAQGVLLVYDVTNEASFSNIKGWMRNLEQHADENVNKILVGNKSDMKDRRAVPYAKGKALADEYNMQFFETSAKDNQNVDEVFTAITKEVLARKEARAEEAPRGGAGASSTPNVAIGAGEGTPGAAKSSCC